MAKHKFIEGIKLLKEGVKPYINDKVCKWTFIILSAILLVFLPLLYFKDLLLIEEKMLFWLFAATSQSMAALFAIVGMFAVFRYQDIQNRLRNKIDVLKEKFQSDLWKNFFGAYTGSRCWDDSEIVYKAKELLEEKEKESPHVIYNKLEVDIKEIESHKEVRDYVRVHAKIPMISILITFMISIFSLPFTAFLSKNCLGLVILILIFELITFSMISIFKYFMISVPPR